METDKTGTTVGIRFRKSNQYFNTIKENIGNYELLDDPDSVKYARAKVSTYISELDFYKSFLYLKTSLAKVAYADEKIDRTLTPVNIEYMAHIMSKSMDYTMPAKSKNNVQQTLADELGRSHKSAYSAINRLKKSQYLIETEDGLIMPNPELQKLRKVTKEHLNNLGCFPVSYMLNFIVK